MAGNNGERRAAQRGLTGRLKRTHPVLRWFLPTRPVDEPVVAREKALLILLFAVVGLTIGGGFSVVFYLYLDSVTGAVGLAIGALIVGAVPFVHRRLGSPRLVGHLLAAVLVVASCFAAFVRGGFRPTALAFVLVVPLLLIFLAGRREALLWSGLSGAAFVAVFILDRLGYMPGLAPAPAHFESIIDLFGLVSLLAMVYVLASFHERGRELAAAERQVAERQLIQAQRLESVGALAAGVAHEINNPLSFVMSNIEFLEGELRSETVDHAAVAEALEDARVGAGRVQRIVKDLNVFSREEEVTDAIDLPAVIDSAIGIVHNELRHRAELRRDYWPVPPIMGNGTRLVQVFVNLLHNAAQAIPEGHAADHRVAVRTVTNDDGNAVVEVSDSGLGIPPDVLPRVFDPFFTTKPVGVGTGLGLALTHDIVRAHGGEIEASSTVNVGTTFVLRFPPTVRRATEPVSTELVPVPVPSRPAHRVLVVDDEPLVGAYIGRLLRRMSDEVVAVQSGLDALERLETGETFDVIICDVMMPDLSGMELYARLGELRADLQDRVVFMTGGAFTAGARQFLDGLAGPCLRKPFTAPELRVALDQVGSRPIRSSRSS